MSDAASEDLTNLLRRATDDATLRQHFLRTLLRSTVYFCASSDAMADSTFEANGQTFRMQDDRSSLDFVELSGRNGPTIPFWTSLDELENDLHRLRLGEQPFMTLTGLEFLEEAQGHYIVLNPGTFAREFSPQQAESLLLRGREEMEAAPQEEAHDDHEEPSQPTPQLQLEEDVDDDADDVQEGEHFDENEFNRFLQDQGPKIPPPTYSETDYEDNLVDDENLSDEDLQGIDINEEEQEPYEDEEFPEDEELDEEELVEDEYEDELEDEELLEEDEELADGELEEAEIEEDEELAPAQAASDEEPAEDEYADEELADEEDLADGELEEDELGEEEIELDPDDPEVIARANLFTNVPDAVAMVKLLLRGRSDEAWDVIYGAQEQGADEGLTKALALLLFTAVDGMGPDANREQSTRRLERLSGFWNEWTQWVQDQPSIQRVDPETLTELSTQLCGCGHPATMHGRYSWPLRDAGIQTTSPCDSKFCICKGFFLESEDAE